MTDEQQTGEKRARRFILLVSALIPVVVAILYVLPKPEDISPAMSTWLRRLPPFYATLNGLTALLLVAAFVAIRNKQVQLHRRLMTLCLAFSILFLVCYVIYHSTMPTTRFGGEGFIRSAYAFILVSHIVLSAAIVPLVLISYTRALAARYDRHRKIARITLPIWLYVAVTGVVVYLMISPYYPQ
jgi:putative membrane protein